MQPNLPPATAAGVEQPMHMAEDPPVNIDGVDLRAVKRRFMAINNDRLKRVYQSLRDRQKIFFEVLPLLFHINHPMLPGYLSTKTPAGVADYTPGNRCIEAGRKLSKSFSYQRRAQRRHRTPPVRDRPLRLGGRASEAHAEIVAQEERVVAEATLTVRRLQDPTTRGALDHE